MVFKVPEPRQLPSGAWTIQLRKEGASITEPTKDACITRARAVRAGFIQQEKEPPTVLLTDAITNGGEHAFGKVGQTWFNVCVKVLIPVVILLIFLNGFGII